MERHRSACSDFGALFATFLGPADDEAVGCWDFLVTNKQIKVQIHKTLMQCGICVLNVSTDRCTDLEKACRDGEQSTVFATFALVHLQFSAYNTGFQPSTSFRSLQCLSSLLTSDENLLFVAFLASFLYVPTSSHPANNELGLGDSLVSASAHEFEMR